MADADESTPMKLLSVILFKHDTNKPLTLLVENLTAEYSFWTRGGIEQACLFISRIVTKGTPLGKMQTVTPQGSSEFDPNSVLADYDCHVIVKADGLAVTAVTSKNYPRRVALELLSKVSEAWNAQHPNWPGYAATEDVKKECPGISKLAAEYQDPRKSDKLLKIQGQLDSTKDLMVQNIEQILARGETIESLVDKTEDLEMSSKVFFKNAEKLNSCWGNCVIL